MASVTFDNVSKEYSDGARAVTELTLQIEHGEFLVFVGPSGCGKTTALRMVAGLETITDGEVRIADVRVNEADPVQRDVAMVFQNYALYPHLTVYENIAFPLRARRMPRSEVRDMVRQTANLLDLTEHLDRRPRNLSGGQRQRVAMGRALVRRPQVFLMDEPLSNLDAKLRGYMRAEIGGLQRELGVTTIYVTHDQVEAMTLGDRIAVMRHGVLQQLGTPRELYDRPNNLFVAQFLGSPPMNLISAVIAETPQGQAIAIGPSQISTGTLVPNGALKGRQDRRVAVGVRPEQLSLAGSSRSEIPLTGKVVLTEMLGPDLLVHLDVHGQPVLTEDVLEIASDVDSATVETLQGADRTSVVRVIARLDPSVDPRLGDELTVAFIPEKAYLFDLESGDRIASAGQLAATGGTGAKPALA